MTRPHLPLIPLALCGLLAACASAPANTPAPPAPAPAQAEAAATQPRGPGLRGQLLGVAANADVDLALLAVDLRGRPRTLLGQVHLRGDGQPLPFHLPLQGAQIPPDLRIELRGRVNQSGRLVQRLPARTIAELGDQDLGTLHLVPAP